MYVREIEGVRARACVRACERDFIFLDVGYAMSAAPDGWGPRRHGRSYLRQKEPCETQKRPTGDTQKRPTGDTQKRPIDT